ncbi:hypothetical protein [Reichenbachiella versicolor]|uniref:hypothetical protein n=1 Tax=Reichenbachiella versicolor TaxID=1821036 RepID=UPI0013A593B6|nr:hypothetical protein [Reichenbachiella versicolor]
MFGFLLSQLGGKENSCRFGSLMRREEKRESVLFPHPSARKMTAVFRASPVRNKNDGHFRSLIRPQQKRRSFFVPHSAARKMTPVFVAADRRRELN